MEESARQEIRMMNVLEPRTAKVHFIVRANAKVKFVGYPLRFSTEVRKPQKMKAPLTVPYPSGTRSRTGCHASLREHQLCLRLDLFEIDLPQSKEAHTGAIL